MKTSSSVSFVVVAPAAVAVGVVVGLVVAAAVVVASLTAAALIDHLGIESAKRSEERRRKEGEKDEEK